LVIYITHSRAPSYHSNNKPKIKIRINTTEEIISKEDDTEKTTSTGDKSNSITSISKIKNTKVSKK